MSTAADPALPHYAYIAQLSSQMLAHARGQDWATVVTLCQRYQQAVEDLCQLVETTGAQAQTVAAPPIDKPARHALLTQILSDDAHLRELTMPELARLGKLLGALKRQRSLHRAYTAS